MWEDKETTAPIPSVAPDGEQPSAFARTVSITEIEETRKQFGKIQIMTMPELMETRFRVRPAVIDGLLPVGTYLLAGAPKIGKSFLVLQMAYQVSMGAPFLGFSSRQGTVLYLALEDTCERLQKRLAQMTEQDSEHLILSVFSETLDEGLTERLSDFWSEHTDTVLIIIDTLQRVRSRTPDGGSYAADYDTLARLKEFSDTVTKSTTDPDCGLFVKGEHKRQFAYEAHTACDKNGFVLETVVTPGNVHDSVAFDEVYDKVTENFPQVEAVVADAAYKTPHICKKVFGDGRVLSTAYKRPHSKNCIKTVQRHIWKDYEELADDARYTLAYAQLYKCRKETIERVFADAKEKHAMRYTQYRGLAQVTNWVKLKFVAMNLKKLDTWKWRNLLSSFRFAVFSLIYVRDPVCS